MATRLPLLILLFLCIPAVRSADSTCDPSRPPSDAILDDLRSQCPLRLSRYLPLEVNGEILDRELSHFQKNNYYSILFHASWCPFSRRARSTFDVLSSMYPQITHFIVEESSAMPSVFSRYGVHSLPALMIANQTTRVWHHGPKDLGSFVLFYRRVTRLDPEVYLTEASSDHVETERSFGPWEGSAREIIAREPYLTFSVLFLCLKLKAFLNLFPELRSRLKSFVNKYVWRINLAISFGETSQLLEKALHVIDVKKVWSKLKLCKTRNFRKGAKNARSWASSLASVSLGESSSSRSTQSDL
ncbi:5'-adenylylsulfate reductase-like 5 [Acorus calamus]|uniref:5'-adenylylsulfate reductase-like 5 n=1 Tax=Acorus calamus TaxID=4465 RepID=A0AAV9DYN6_ACOCL|nr:5'-adenylylsulfate reductase-like 5 [Acorus calamus]